MSEKSDEIGKSSVERITGSTHHILHSKHRYISSRDMDEIRRDKRHHRRRSRSRSYDRDRYRSRRSSRRSRSRSRSRERRKKKHRKSSKDKKDAIPPSTMSADQLLKKIRSLTGKSPEEQMARELYIGGLPVGISSPVLVEFMDRAMKQYGLAKNLQDRSCTRASLSGDGSFAFVEFATIEETDRAITKLNGVPCLGSPLKIGRPAHYTGNGPTTGSFQPSAPILPKLNIDDGAAQKLMNQLEEKIELKTIEAPSRNIKIENMLTDEMMSDLEELQTMGKEVCEECAEYGIVKKVYVPELMSADERDIFVKFETIAAATEALDALNGRTFDERELKASFVHDRKFAKLAITTTSCIPTPELTKKR